MNTAVSTHKKGSKVIACISLRDAQNGATFYQEGGGKGRGEGRGQREQTGEEAKLRERIEKRHTQKIGPNKTRVYSRITIRAIMHAIQQ